MNQAPLLAQVDITTIIVRSIEPSTRGLIGSGVLVGASGFVASAIWPHVVVSPEFLRTAAAIGASLFLAFIIEATWVAARFDTDPKSEVLLGFVTGLAAWGFVGVASLLVLSESHDPGPLQGSESLYFWFSVIGLALLGISVAFQPVVTHTWENEDDEND